jgi:hypothetical protein
MVIFHILMNLARLRSPQDRAHPVPSSFFTRHALRMNIVNIITAKIIAPGIVNMAISSLIISVPVLSVSPS